MRDHEIDWYSPSFPHLWQRPDAVQSRTLIILDILVMFFLDLITREQQEPHQFPQFSSCVSHVFPRVSQSVKSRRFAQEIFGQMVQRCRPCRPCLVELDQWLQCLQCFQLQVLWGNMFGIFFSIRHQLFC